ncbi:MAG: hypothetical protein L0Z62_48675 [Gemmataceae bacterium]|nr:hypothetical protein [Gemmataceae bacterium]
MSTISFQCYSCNQVLKVGGDKAGKKGKCPKCGTMLTIPVASTIDDSAGAPAPPPPMHAPPMHAPPMHAPHGPAMAPPPFDPTGGGAYLPGAPVQGVPMPPGPMRAEAVDDDDYGAPRGRGREEDYGEEEDYAPRRRATWGMPKIGLLINFISFCVIAGAWVLMVIGYLLLSIFLIQILTRSMPSLGSLETAATLLGIGQILQLIGCGGAVAGYILCALGPPQKGARAMAITAASVTGGYLLMALIVIIVAASARVRQGMGGGVAGLPMAVGTGAAIMTILMQLLFAASLIMGCLYLRAASMAMKKRWNADSCTAPLVMASIYAAAQLLFNVMGLIRTASPWPGWVILILMWVFIGVLITFLVQFILLVWRTRSLMR